MERMEHRPTGTHERSSPGGPYKPVVKCGMLVSRLPTPVNNPRSKKPFDIAKYQYTNRPPTQPPQQIDTVMQIVRLLIALAASSSAATTLAAPIPANSNAWELAAAK